MAHSTRAADILRHVIEECPNGCGELHEEHGADGLHLVCRECGFFATEEWVTRMVRPKETE